jgi:hypothetical protein
MVWVQAIRAQASRDSSSHTALMLNYRRESTQPGVLPGADAVLDPRVDPVPGLQMEELPDLGVGGEGLEAVTETGKRHFACLVSTCTSPKSPSLGKCERSTRRALCAFRTQAVHHVAGRR